MSMLKAVNIILFFSNLTHAKLTCFCLLHFQGMDIIFKLGIAILQTSQDLLLNLDMEGMLKVSI